MDGFLQFFGLAPTENKYLPERGDRYIGTTSENPLNFTPEQKRYVQDIYDNWNQGDQLANKYITQLKEKGDISDFFKNFQNMGNVAIVAGAVVVYLILRR